MKYNEYKDAIRHKKPCLLLDSVRAMLRHNRSHTSVVIFFKNQSDLSLAKSMVIINMLKKEI